MMLEVRNLIKYFPVYGGVFPRPKGWVHAVDDVCLFVGKGETLGLVGESGCGKTTLGRCASALYDKTGGTVLFKGEDVFGMGRSRLKALRLKMQMIFQDPFESLNSRQMVGQILAEKYHIHKMAQPGMNEEIARTLETVGLEKDDMVKYPHEFSGGQRQRIGIARAVSLDPELIVCDEPVSALDVSVQSKILNLLLRLQREMYLTYIFISHDLSVVKHISDRIAVMYLGKIVETADADTIYEKPCHPYTEALISAIPDPDPENTKKRVVLKGEIPSVENPPQGCRFHTRCMYVKDICSRKEPPLSVRNARSNHFAACHLF